MSVTVVIPAYNEATRIGRVVRAALGARRVSQVLVVSDGSTDDTATRAEAAGADVIVLDGNRGKAAAMDAGVRVAKYDGICFLDADLVGLRPHHVDALVEPYFRGVKMTVAAITPLQRLVTVTSGMRVLARSSWQFAMLVEPQILTSGYGVEVGLVVVANRYGWSVEVVEWEGVGNVRKGVKWGDGVGRSIAMWARVWVTAKRTAGCRLGPDLLDHLSRGGYANREWRRMS